MATYIYGIIDSNRAPDDPMTGLEGAPVHILPHRNLGVLISDFPAWIRNATKDRAIAHERVVERFMADFTVLPFRFLTLFAKKEDVRAMMNDRYGDFKDNLERLRGKAEFGIKVIWPGARIRARITPRENGAPVPAPASPAIRQRDASSGRSSRSTG